MTIRPAVGHNTGSDPDPGTLGRITFNCYGNLGH